VNIIRKINFSHVKQRATLLIVAASLLADVNATSSCAVDKQKERKHTKQTMGDLGLLNLKDLMNIKVQTASRHEESRKDTPAQTVVITRNQIKQRRYRSLLDLMQDLPSVDVQKRNDVTQDHTVALRGQINHRKFLILQDGVRLTTPGGDNLGIADNFPLYHARQVEIVYGPAAAVYGADAFGGVINIITQTGEQQNGMTVSAGQGSDHGQYRYFFGGMGFKNGWSAALGGHTQRMDLSHNLSSRYPDSYRLVDAKTFTGNLIVAADQREPFSAMEKSRSAFARLDYEKTFSLNFYHTELMHLSSTGDKPRGSLYHRDAIWENQLNSLSLRYRHTFANDLNTETRVHFLQHELDPQSHFSNIFVDFGRGYKYAKGRRFTLEQSFQYCWTDKHYLSGGMSYERTYALPRTTDLNSPYDPNKGPTEQGLVYENTDIPVQINDMRYKNVGIYAQIRSNWTDTISTVSGLRYDKNSRYEGTFNPRLSLIYQPTDKTVIKLLYGESFRAPTPNESLRQFGTFSGKRNEQGDYISSFFAVPNLNLKPEKLRSLELNLQHIITPQISAEMSLYYNQVSDLIRTRSESNPEQFIPGAYLEGGSLKDNLDQAVIYGAEFSLDYRRKLNRNWRLQLWTNYSYIDGYIDDSSEKERLDLPYTALHKLKLGAVFTYKKHYFITPRFYLIAPSNSARLDEQNPGQRVQSPGYGLFNLHLGATKLFNSNVSVYLDIENVLNRRYFHAGGETNATALVQNPQPARNWMLSLQYQFK